MRRREFMQSAALCTAGGSLLLSTLGGTDVSAQTSTTPTTQTKESKPMKIVIAADPFALQLKDAVLAHLKQKGHDVTDVGATASKQTPYFESCVVACKYLQEKKAERAILFCGTGMGMSVIANRFPGVVASCVESVFATKICRTINDANALCLGSMIWGEFMAIDAVDTFLTTEFTEALPQFADFLKDAKKKVEAIKP